MATREYPLKYKCTHVEHISFTLPKKMPELTQDLAGYHHQYPSMLSLVNDSCLCALDGHFCNPYTFDMRGHGIFKIASVPKQRVERIG